MDDFGNRAIVPWRGVAELDWKAVTILRSSLDKPHVLWRPVGNVEAGPAITTVDVNHVTVLNFWSFVLLLASGLVLPLPRPLPGTHKS